MRKSLLLIARLAAALALALSLALPAGVQAQAPAKDWSKTVAKTSVGAFRLGNPDARTKLVEYFSYTCPHCAHFAHESDAGLGAMVKSGQVSIEFRTYVRDGFDLAATLIARCGGEAKFLANHKAIFAGYDGWMEKAEAYAKAQAGKPAPADQTDQLLDVAEQTGLIALAGKNGIAPAAARACVADKDALATVLAIRAGVWDVDPKFVGTPSFLLDGKPIGNMDWAGLKAKLPSATASAK